MSENDYFELAKAKYVLDHGVQPTNAELEKMVHQLKNELSVMSTSGCMINYPSF